MKQRTSEDIMKPLKDKSAPKSDFKVVADRKWDVVRDLASGKPVAIDWRNPRFWQNQLFKIKVGDEEAVISRQELEMVLRHV